MDNKRKGNMKDQDKRNGTEKEEGAIEELC